MIKLDYLAHSSFLVTCGETKIIFDPWLNGPAFFRQWFLWPLAVKNATKIKTDAVIITHGHEDHLHTPSLREMDKDAHVFFPFQWRDGAKSFLNYIGFKKITEAVTFKTYLLNDVKITFISFSLESVVVIEYKNEVIVNINDALNSNHENAVEFMLKEIKQRWPKIDYLLSGWSGASYFPNQVRYPGKNDLEIGKLREQYFANNFCQFTKELQPKYSMPFCSGFLLVKPENQWINHVKFPRNKVEEYYKKYFEDSDKVKMIVAFPGDTIENGVLEKKSELHSIESEDAQYDLAYKYYEKEIIEASAKKIIEEEKIEKLILELDHWMNYNKQLYHQKVLEDSVFSIRLEDAEAETYLNVRFGEDKKFHIEKSNLSLADKRLLITTSAEKMLFALKKVWGGDVLTAGYGLVIEVYDQLSLEKNLDIVCVRLITRYPMARKDLLRFPIRALKFYTQNPKLTSVWLKQKVKLKPYVNRYPYNERDHWLSYNKCDLCAVCRMPEIDLDKFEMKKKVA